MGRVWGLFWFLSVKGFYCLICIRPHIFFFPSSFSFLDLSLSIFVLVLSKQVTAQPDGACDVSSSEMVIVARDAM